MYYQNTAEVFSNLVLARDPKELALMKEAASQTGNVEFTVLFRGADDETVHVAGEAYATYAEEFNASIDRSLGQVASTIEPSAHRGTAERIVRSGGAVIHLVATEPANTSDFYNRLES